MTQLGEIIFLGGAWLGVFLLGMLWGRFIAAVNDPAHADHDCYDPDGTMSDAQYQQDLAMRRM